MLKKRLPKCGQFVNQWFILKIYFTQELNPESVRFKIKINWSDSQFWQSEYPYQKVWQENH